MSLNVARRSYGRRNVSIPTSGSARRRALRRRAAEESRVECERQIRERKELLQKQRLENQRMAREELSAYCPWGRPGGGAPNPASIRFTDLRRRQLFPEDELKRMADVNVTSWQWPVRRRRGPHRLHEDSQLRFDYGDAAERDGDTGRGECERDNTRAERERLRQAECKKRNDEIAETKKKEMKDSEKRNVELERKLGWTNEEAFEKLQNDHRKTKRSSVALPEIAKINSISSDDNKEEKPSNVTKLPDINAKSHSDSETNKKVLDNKTGNVEKPKQLRKDHNNADKRPNETVVKHLNNGRSVKKVIEDADNEEFKSTPDSTILRMTGGVELVPLLARRRRVGARTLPSSDVTRPPEDPLQWRNFICDEYLQELKHQMQLKCQQKEDCRRDSAEECRRHQETWAGLWGRPGHGAPLPGGRWCRNNLAHLLYLAPLHPASVQ